MTGIRFISCPRSAPGWPSDHTDVYRYLPESIRTFPDQNELAAMLREAGFSHVEYRNLSGGIVAIHVAVKPGLPERPSTSLTLRSGRTEEKPFTLSERGG